MIYPFDCTVRFGGSAQEPTAGTSSNWNAKVNASSSAVTQSLLLPGLSGRTQRPRTLLMSLPRVSSSCIQLAIIIPLIYLTVRYWWLVPRTVGWIWRWNLGRTVRRRWWVLLAATFHLNGGRVSCEGPSR